MATLNTKLILRNDTAENWNTSNPVLLAGEAGVETDTRLMKIGDGSTVWQNLSYINKFEGTEPATHYEVAATPEQTDEEVIATAVAAPNTDDIVIVKRTISDDKISRTAYVRGEDAWKALDGNYDANNVYFDKDLTITAPIGVVTIPSSGSTTVAAKGKSLAAVLSSIMAARKTPTATKPSISVTFSNAEKSLEVGTTVTPAYTTTFNAGRYTYGPATGINAQSWEVKDNQGNTKTTDSGTFDPLTIADNLTYSLTATATYNEGAMPVDNLGNDYEEARIAAGSASATTSTKLTGYRSFFYGALTTSSEDAPLTSEIIRDLTNGKAYNSAKQLTVQPGALGAKRVVVAFPANTTRGGLESAILTSSMNADITENYQKVANVDVEGANHHAAIPYSVYVYEPKQIGEDEVHQINLA